MITRKIYFIGLPILIALHLYLGSRAISALSPTYDEPVHLTAGAVALKTGNMKYNGLHHPIFGEMWAALPMLLSKPMLPVQSPLWLAQNWSPQAQYQFADLFLYHNRVSHETLLRGGRWMQLFLSVLLFSGAAKLILRAYGPAPALWFATFWAFSPTMLAHSTVISTDLAFAGFFFLFFLAYATNQNTIALGVLLGVCFVSKYLALAMLPIAAFLWIIDERSFTQGAIMCGVALLVILSLYGFHADVFWKGLFRIVVRAQEGRSSYFLGQRSTNGALAYFPFAFFAKSTLFELGGLGAVVYLAARRQMKIPRALWLPPAVFFIIASFSKVQIGHRHILVVYPFVFLLGALALQERRHRWRHLFPTVAVLMFAGSLLLSPNYLTYFNPLVGGPTQGYRYMTDSNNDWGQGLKQLAAALDPEDLKEGIYLCYFGTGDPHAYGLRYFNIGSDTLAGHTDDSGDLSVHPAKFAISVTNLQGTYYADAAAFAWLKDKTPWKKVGNTIFVYDFSDDIEALTKLNELRGGA